MIFKVFNLEIGLYILILIILIISVTQLTKYYHKEIKERKFNANYFRIPIYHSIIILSFLLPLIISITAYLVANFPDSEVSSLLTSILILFVSLVVAIWQSFAILKVANSENDLITLKIPDDLRFISAIGIIYITMIFGFLLLSKFFLFDFRIHQPQKSSHSITQSNGGTYIRKHYFEIGLKEEEIKKIWGSPTEISKLGDTLKYDGLGCKYILLLNKKGEIVEFTQKKSQ